MTRRFTLVRIALGSLLLVTAALKLYGLSVSAIPRVGWFSQPWVQLAAVEWEVILGLWLLSGSYPRGAWLAALGTFAVFAAVSGYLGWIGVASCGCFGVIKASPWWAFGLDAAAIVLLLAFRPRRKPVTATELSASIPEGVKWLGGAVVLLLGLTGAATVIYGSPATALARLRGETLTVANPYLDFGSGKPGDSLEATATIRNWSDRPIIVVGGTSDCTCATVTDLPLTLEPAGEARVRIQLTIPNSAHGQFTRKVSLLTDSPDQPEVAFHVGCRIE